MLTFYRSWTTLTYLRWQVQGRPTQCVGLVSNIFRKAKVYNNRVAIFVDEHILRFQITINVSSVNCSAWILVGNVRCVRRSYDHSPAMLRMTSRHAP